jgi:sugar lactone lactonase YvrE
MRRPLRLLLPLLLLLPPLGWLALAPVPIEPVAWEAPANPGYFGVFAPNRRLADLQAVDLKGALGPEDATQGPDGRLYLPTHDGALLVLDPMTGDLRELAHTGGRPLGLQWDSVATRLVVADAYRGLLSVDPDSGAVRLLCDTADGLPIRYADHLDIDPQGRVWFSDASTRFGAEAWGGTWPASLLDVMEHGGHGRLLVYDPATEGCRTRLDGLQFANGVALTADGLAALVVETSAYRVLRVPLEGGEPSVFIDALPGFPDNIRRGRDGRTWLGLISARSAPLDLTAGWPGLRKVIQRLPAFLRPKDVPYGHVVALDESGRVVASLQDPSGAYPKTTGVLETADRLWITSLSADRLGWLPAAVLGDR